MTESSPAPRRLARAVLAAAWVALGTAWLPPANAQAEGDDAEAEVLEDADASGVLLSADEARRVLAQPIPDEPDARYVALQRMRRAAQVLEERGRLVEISRLLAEAGRGRPGGEAWIVPYLSAEFTWGSQGKALQACEPFIADTSLPLAVRASIALRQAYFASHGTDRAVFGRLWSRADAMAAEAVKQGGPAPARLAVDRLSVRSEYQRWQGDHAGAVASLREAVGVGRRAFDAAKARSPNARSPERLDTYGVLDGALGMLTYALVRQGRSQEAIDVSQSNLALWRAGEISDGIGAKWNYRSATSLVSTQRYSAGLEAARLSDQMLARAGASNASHTRWLARQEIVRALIGLKRWKEADESYREFLANMPPDVLARTRASDWRLIALLGSKNGRLDEALETVERVHRIRLRLYGSKHPQTQEAAGVRAVVRLLRGELPRAMADYDELFAARSTRPAAGSTWARAACAATCSASPSTSSCASSPSAR